MEPKLFRQAKLKAKGFSPDQFESHQVFVTSPDGTQVPMFIVHKKGIQLDGSNPTLLYGYGGMPSLLLQSTIRCTVCVPEHACAHASVHAHTRAAVRTICSSSVLMAVHSLYMLINGLLQSISCCAALPGSEKGQSHHQSSTVLDRADRYCLYAGFNISLEPSFSVARLCFMLAYNGVFAMANLR